jgi:hypothetical protein
VTATYAHRLIANWLTDLGKLTAGSAPLPDAKGKIAAMTLALAEEFDASAFTRDSLTFVARRCKFFPTFGEATSALSEWRKEHPRQPAIAASVHDPNTELHRKHEAEKVQAEASWRTTTEQQVRAKVRSLEGHPFRDTLGRMLATALRRHQPGLVAHLPPEFLKPLDERATP